MSSYVNYTIAQLQFIYFLPSNFILELCDFFVLTINDNACVFISASLSDKNY